MSKSKVEKPVAVSGNVVEVVPLADVHLDVANVRRHPERNQAAIRASLTRFRGARSIVLDGNNVVRAGNGTLEQASAAGIDEVLVVEPKPNQIVAVRRPDWSPSEATAYAIADNRSSELAVWDETGLAEQLRALQSEDFDLAAVGYDAGEVEVMLERLAGEIVPNFQPGSIEDQGSLDRKAPVTCPECGHEFSPA